MASCIDCKWFTLYNCELYHIQRKPEDPVCEAFHPSDGALYRCVIKEGVCVFCHQQLRLQSWGVVGGHRMRYLVCDNCGASYYIALGEVLWNYPKGWWK